MRKRSPTPHNQSAEPGADSLGARVGVGLDARRTGPSPACATRCGRNWFFLRRPARGRRPHVRPRIRRRGAEMSPIELNETRGCSLDDRSEQTSSPGGCWAQAGPERSRSNVVHTARTRETTPARSPRSCRSTGSRTISTCMTTSYRSRPLVGWRCSTSWAGGIRQPIGLPYNESNQMDDLDAVIE